MIRSLTLIAALCGTAAAAGTELFPPDPIDCVIRPREMIDLSSREPGVLTEILVDRGDKVGAGQLVARLEDDLQRSAVELAALRAANTSAETASQARVVFRRAEMARLRSLYERQVASASDLEEAEVELRLAELELESAQAEKRMAEANLADARLRLQRREIRSAVEGLVVRVTGAPGEFTDEQAEVLTIAILDPLVVEAFVPIALYPQLAMGQRATVRIAAPFDVTREATVSAIDQVFDAGSGTLGVRLDLPNPGGVMPSGLRCALQLREAGEGQ